ncbi:MAG TPA: phage terminase large subunit family protein, partial [Terriglobus sp.]
MLPSATESIEAFETMLLDACVLLRPPEKLTVDEWADKYAYLSPEGSAKPGKFYTSTTEYLRGPLRELTPGTKWQTCVMMFGSQLGKTEAGLKLTGFHMHQDPGPILFVEPTEDLCKVIARDRIEPMIRDTPVLTPLFGTKGGRNTGNDTLAKQFPGGRLSFG